MVLEREGAKEEGREELHQSEEEKKTYAEFLWKTCMSV